MSLDCGSLGCDSKLNISIDVSVCGRASQVVDWGCCQSIKSIYAQMSLGKGLQLLQSKYQAAPEP